MAVAATMCKGLKLEGIRSSSRKMLSTNQFTVDSTMGGRCFVTTVELVVDKEDGAE